MVIFGYRTKKTKSGYTYVVTRGTERKKPNKVGQYVDTKIIHAGTRKTRARALGTARKYVGYYRYKRDLFGKKK